MGSDKEVETEKGEEVEQTRNVITVTPANEPGLNEESNNKSKEEQKLVLKVNRIPRKLGVLSKRKVYASSAQKDDSDSEFEGNFSSPEDEVAAEKKTVTKRRRAIEDDEDIIEDECKPAVKQSHFVHCVAGYHPSDLEDDVVITHEANLDDVKVQEQLEKVSGHILEIKNIYESKGFCDELFVVLFNMHPDLVRFEICPSILMDSVKIEFEKMMKAYANYDKEGFAAKYQAIMSYLMRDVYTPSGYNGSLNGAVFSWSKDGNKVRSWYEITEDCKGNFLFELLLRCTLLCLVVVVLMILYLFYIDQSNFQVSKDPMVLKQPVAQAPGVSTEQRYGRETQQEYQKVKSSWRPPALPPADPRVFITDVNGNITVLPRQESNKETSYVATTNSKFGYCKGSAVIYCCI